MGSDSTKASSLSVDDAPSRLSFFARLAAPLRSRSRNLADFHIRLKEPHRQYVAGDHVRGFVVLSVIKPFRITHLTVALHGHVRAFKHAGSAAQLATIDPGTFSTDGSSNYRYHGNGHASLFKDEQVLCGDGRLQQARFEFEFDLVFPEKGLPSSIDFERGSISYLLTATITRPTAITPTTSCETKVSFTEQIDAGVFSAPSEKRIAMQTMKKKPRRRRTTTPAVAPAVRITPAVAENIDAVSDMDSTRENIHSNQNSTVEGSVVASYSAGSQHRSAMNSDIQSEISGDSAVSNNSSSGRGGDASGESHTGASRIVATEGGEITATIEVLKGGSIAGDVVPVRIRVNHNRRLKSMHGVIVTLYRQGRVDYAPPIHMFANLSKEDSERLERDEYYPKSKTGLGGLSLSSAGSCSVFRKDLYQTVSPLIVDPRTLIATINTSVRVPEDAFPSIKGVPGGLISFKYYVEVIVDLGGRLAGSASAVTQQSSRVGGGGLHTGGVPVSLNSFENNTAGWAGSIVDTDHIRREKGVISVATEVIIGTTDSSRSKRNKNIARPALTIRHPTTTSGHDHHGVDESGFVWPDDQQPAAPLSRTYSREASVPIPPAEYSPRHIEPSYAQASTSQSIPHHESEAETPQYVPPPQIPAEYGLSEKERARLAEQRLLPSQPPSGPPGPSEAGPSSRPSVPTIEEADAPPQHHLPVLARQPSHLSDLPPDGPSAPSFVDLNTSASSHPSDDKQELERRRLLQEASAPPEVPEEYQVSSSSQAGPSAPPMLSANGSGSVGASPGYVGDPGPSAPPAAMLATQYSSNTSRHGGEGLDEEHFEARDPMNMIAGPSNAGGNGTEPLPRYER